MSLLDNVKGVMTNTVVDKLTDVLGIENSMAKSALKMFLPAIIGGVINKGTSSGGAGGLLDLFKNGGFGDDNLNNLPEVFSDSSKRDGWLKTGTDLLGNIFGNNQSGLLDMLLKTTGIGKGAGSSLLSMLAPIVINKLAGIVMGKNMNASQLNSYLSDQKEDIMGLVPGLAGIMGGNIKEDMAAAMGASQAKSETDRPAATAATQESSGGGVMKWLLPLALAAAAFWFFNQKGCASDADTDQTEVKVDTNENKATASEKAAPATRTTTSTTDAAEVKVLSADDMASYTFNDKGDILTGSGSVAYSGGSYDIDANGNLVRSDGKIIAPAASISSDFMQKLRNAISSFKIENMRVMFGDMIAKKAGVENTYALSNIEFNSENHMITNFSKSEVEGLARALKANATGKIEVQVHTADGDSKKDGKKLSETRAKVIRDMLVTLGVKADQIKAVGMGSSEEAKANIDKVDIVVN